MKRSLAAVLAVAALACAATAAGAESPEDDRARAHSGGASDESERPAEPSAVRGGDSVARPAPEGLTGDEQGALAELASENPDLADQAGGYVSNDELLTILLVVLIVVLIL